LPEVVVVVVVVEVAVDEGDELVDDDEVGVGAERF
jgi:hypothetical protein